MKSSIQSLLYSSGIVVIKFPNARGGNPFRNRRRSYINHVSILWASLSGSRLPPHNRFPSQPPIDPLRRLFCNNRRRIFCCLPRTRTHELPTKGPHSKKFVHLTFIGSAAIVPPGNSVARLPGFRITLRRLWWLMLRHWFLEQFLLMVLLFLSTTKGSGQLLVEKGVVVMGGVERRKKIISRYMTGQQWR